VLIKLVGPPIALLVDAVMLLVSALILRGIQVNEPTPARGGEGFWPSLRAGLAFVRGNPLLVALALVAGGWQMCQHAAQGVIILHGTRGLGLSEQAIGLCYAGLGLGTISASVVGHRLSQHFGPGPAMVVGTAVCGLGWLLPSLWPSGAAGVAAFAAMLVLTGLGGVLMYINFLAMRQAVTPAPLLGRMTTTMRWLILLPAAPGALAGGWIAEHVGLSQALGAAGISALLLSVLAWRSAAIQRVQGLPSPDTAG
jgi:predicted MFS family arabinose efflux permease